MRRCSSELPRRVLEARGAGARAGRRDSLDGLVEADVRILPIEDANEVIAECTGRFSHGTLLADVGLTIPFDPASWPLAHRRPSRKRLATSSGFWRSASAAWFIARMSAAEIRPRQPFQRVRTCGYRSSVGCARHRHGVVRRKIVPVVLELDEVEALDQSCRGVAGDQIDLPRRERPVAERQVHDLRRAAKREAVGLREPADSRPAAPGTRIRSRPAIAVPPLPRPRSSAGPARRASAPRTRIANVLSKPSGGRSVRPLSAYRRRTVSHDGLAIVRRRPMEDGRQRGAGVLDVDVDVAGERARDRRSACRPGSAGAGPTARSRARSSARRSRRGSTAR